MKDNADFVKTIHLWAYKLNNDFIMLLDERRRCWSAADLRLSVVSNFLCIQVFADETEKYDQSQSLI